MSAKPRRKLLIAARPNGLSFPWVHKGRWALIVKTAFRWCHHRVKSQSTVGAGDSMVGAMTLKLAENASLEEMVRFGVAAGSAATLNQGTRLCSHDDTQKIYAYLSR